MSWVWWCRPTVLVLWRLRQEDYKFNTYQYGSSLYHTNTRQEGHKMEVSLGYRVRSV